MNKRKMDIIEYLNSIKLDAGMLNEVREFISANMNNNIRPIRATDTHRVGVLCVILDVTGRGSNQMFHGFTYRLIDIDDVTPKFANVYVYDREHKSGKPMHIKLDSIKFSIFND